jgi:hypothetical protein
MPRKSNHEHRSHIDLSLRWANKCLKLPQESIGEFIDSNYSMEMEDQEKDIESNGLNLCSESDLNSIGDMFQGCKRSCGSRKLLVLVWTLVRQIGIIWREIDGIMDRIGAYRVETAHQWAITCLLGEQQA